MKTELLAPEVIMALIIGMGATNLTLRTVPLVLLSKVKLPRVVERWLSFVPIAVMGALVAGEVLVPAGNWVYPLPNPGFWAALIAALAYRLSRSFIGGTMAGIIAFVLLRGILA